MFHDKLWTYYSCSSVMFRLELSLLWSSLQIYLEDRILFQCRETYIDSLQVPLTNLLVLIRIVGIEKASKLGAIALIFSFGRNVSSKILYDFSTRKVTVRLCILKKSLQKSVLLYWKRKPVYFVILKKVFTALHN